MTDTYEATVRHAGLSFGEAPRWHKGRLWFSDFYRHGVFSLGDEGERLELTVDTQPSGLGWADDGTMLVVSMTDTTVLAVTPDGRVRRHADISAYCGYWANDMVVAASGTAYVGNFGYNLDKFLREHGPAALFGTPGPPTTNIVVLDPTGAVIQVVGDMAFPNGMVLSDDGATLIAAETIGRRLSAFDVAADGTLSNRRVFAQFERVLPDGICLDAEGQVWLANASTAECLRVAEGGQVTARVTTSQPSFACMLGGKDRTTLHALTAPSSDSSASATTRDGKVEIADVAVPGAGLP